MPCLNANRVDRFKKGDLVPYNKLNYEKVPCRICKTMFEKKRPNHSCCSVKCSGSAENKRITGSGRKLGVNLKYPNIPCAQCGTVFKRHDAESRFCSRECSRKDSIVLKNIECGKCGITFKPNYKHRKFCTNKCAVAYNRDLMPTTDITPLEMQKIRNSKVYIQMRATVLFRDNYTCTLCGCIEKVMHIHHIKPFAYFPEGRLDKENVVTMCQPCHLKQDTSGVNLLKYFKNGYQF